MSIIEILIWIKRSKQIMIVINIKKEYYQKLVLRGLNNYINFLIKAIKDMLILKIYSMF
jgi:hypothetical protein